MVYLIYFKNFYECHNVIPLSMTIKYMLKKKVPSLGNFNGDFNALEMGKNIIIL
jgi:hypothetical protein